MSVSYNTGLRLFATLRSQVDHEHSEERKAYVQKDHRERHRQQRQLEPRFLREGLGFQPRHGRA